MSTNASPVNGTTGAATVPPPSSTQPPSAERLVAMYRMMLLIRRFEEVIGECAAAREFRGPVHLYIGQEAIAVGACAALRADDYVFGGHRSHGHYLAKGGDLPALAAEIYGRVTGCCRGRGGSMHLTAPTVGVLGTSALVGGGIATGVGTALASVLRGHDRVTTIFFGDGAVEEGVFHESLNLAAVKKLPVIFVCENNGFSSHLPMLIRQPKTTVYEHALPYDVPSLSLDGNDVLAVHASAGAAVERARRGGGPTLLEFITYRWRGHVGPSWDVDKGLRTQAEVDHWIGRCPIKQLGARLREADLVTAAELEDVASSVETEVMDAIAFARSSPSPAPAEILEFVYKQ